MQQFGSLHFDASSIAHELVPVGEILAAFSYALDLTGAQPPGHSIRSAYIAVRMAKAMGLSDQKCIDIHYATLLKDLGCSSNASDISALFTTDDRHFKRDIRLIDGRLRNRIGLILSHSGGEETLGRRALAIGKALAVTPGTIGRLIAMRCERGAEIAARLRMSPDVCEGIHNLPEHWDGSGLPRRLSRSDIPLASQLALLAQVADAHYTSYDWNTARDEIALRSGRWFDPGLVALFRHLTRSAEFWAVLGSPDLKARLLALCEGHMLMLADEAYLDEIAAAFGAVIDAKSPFTAGHSDHVGKIVGAIARHMDIDDARQRKLIRAARLHDVGKLGVSNLILDKPGDLTEREWMAMQLHSEHTTNILGRVEAFSDMAMIAGAHHERLDGKGYPLGLTERQLPIDTRIISIADVFDALTADRPYRDALPLDRAMAIIHDEAGDALDPAVVSALEECLDAGAIQPSSDGAG